MMRRPGGGLRAGQTLSSLAAKDFAMIAAAVVGRKSRTAPPTEDGRKRSHAAGHGSTGVVFESCGAGAGTGRGSGEPCDPSVGHAGAQSEVEVYGGKALDTLAHGSGGADACWRPSGAAWDPRGEAVGARPSTDAAAGCGGGG